MFIKIQSFIISVITLFCSVFNIPYYAAGKEVDKSKFVQTFEDEFDEDSVDWNVWSGHYQYGDTTVARKGSYWNKNVTYTENGNLVIPLEYLEEGRGGKGAGWYTAGIDTDSDSPNGFSQQFGYFECRCKLPKCADGWSAFWLMNEGVYNVDGSGRDGTEIDIFESNCYGHKKNMAVSSNLHWDGYDKDHKSMGAHKYLIEGNPYEEFNTYGLEWNESEYIFYVNGKKVFSTDKGGVSQHPEYLILSLEVGGKDGIPDNRPESHDTDYFIVDYVRVYQYKDLLRK